MIISFFRQRSVWNSLESNRQENERNSGAQKEFWRLSKCDWRTTYLQRNYLFTGAYRTWEHHSTLKCHPSRERPWHLSRFRLHGHWLTCSHSSEYPRRHSQTVHSLLSAQVSEVHALSKFVAQRFKAKQFTPELWVPCEGCRFWPGTFTWQEDWLAALADWLCCDEVVPRSWNSFGLKQVHQRGRHVEYGLHSCRAATWQTSVPGHVNAKSVGQSDGGYRKTLRGWHRCNK